jgi:hypothetical protein
MRFVCSDPAVGDLEFEDVEALLDALETALVSPETSLLDRARQSWQPLGLHPEVRTAWEIRARYRPPGSSVFALPPIPSIEELQRASRSEPRTDSEPAKSRHRIATVGLLWAVLVLGLVGWAIVAIAGEVASLAAHSAGFQPGSR